MSAGDPLGEQQLLTGWLAGFNAVLPDGILALRSDDVDSNEPPAEYLEVGLTRRLADSLRMSGGPRPRIGWRLTTRVVALSSDSARFVRQCAAQLQDSRLPEFDTGPLDFESEEPIGDDDGRQSGLTTWAFDAPRLIPATP